MLFFEPAEIILKVAHYRVVLCLSGGDWLVEVHSDDTILEFGLVSLLEEFQVFDIVSADVPDIVHLIEECVGGIKSVILASDLILEQVLSGIVQTLCKNYLVEACVWSIRLASVA